MKVEGREGESWHWDGVSIQLHRNRTEDIGSGTSSVYDARNRLWKCLSVWERWGGMVSWKGSVVFRGSMSMPFCHLAAFSLLSSPLLLSWLLFGSSLVKYPPIRTRFIMLSSFDIEVALAGNVS